MILLGQDCDSGEPVRIQKRAFSTHFHLIGGTGKGKTTAIHTLLHPLLTDPSDNSCTILIDRLGNLTQELALWMASPEFCTDRVRERLVYIQPSREDCILPFNPLTYDTQAHGYYKVERATEIVLRAWESVNIEAMPRLARWTFNAFWAAAQLGLTIADCNHFLMPGSPYHAPLLNVLPPRLKAEWEDIANARSQEAVRILDSSRNRLKPYFESDILRRMFGTTQTRFNVEQFMREGKIVLVDLAPRNRLAGQLANTIGALVINEVLATARNLPFDVRYPTYLFLDEFQNFVGPDIEGALPEVRQLGLKLFLSHQSFSQLQRGEYDLTSMIFQAQSRMIFGVQGEDADLLAHEVASITYDPDKIKDEIYSRRQLHKGHSVIELSSWSEAASKSQAWSDSYGKSWGTGRDGATPFSNVSNSLKQSEHYSQQEGRTNSGGSGTTSSHGRSQQLVPEYENFEELSSRTYLSFEEQKAIWAREIRNLPTGQALLRLVDDPNLRRVAVKRSAPGHLQYDLGTVARQFPKAIEAMERLLEKNFQSDLFISADEIDRETERRLTAAITQRLKIPGEFVTDQMNGSGEAVGEVNASSQEDLLI